MDERDHSFTGGGILQYNNPCEIPSRTMRGMSDYKSGLACSYFDSPVEKARSVNSTISELIGKEVDAVQTVLDFEANSDDMDNEKSFDITVPKRREQHVVPVIAALDSFSNVCQDKSYERLFTADDDVDWIMWLRRFNDLINMAATHLTDQQKAFHLIGNLAGRARDAVETLADADKRKYDVVVNKVRSLITGPEEKSLARRRLNNCRQEEGESVQQFLTRLRRIVQSALQGKGEGEVEERFLEEFMDRLYSILREGTVTRDY